MGGNNEYGVCRFCNTVGNVNRKYYRYDVKCDCCNSKNDYHFEYVKHCNSCEPKPPTKITVHLEPLADN